MANEPTGDSESSTPDEAPPSDDPPSGTIVDTIGEFIDDLRIVRVSLVIIAIAAIIGILHFAKPILIPIVLAFFLSYVLTPFVNLLMKLRIPATQVNMPRGLAALVVVICSVSFAGFLGTFIGDQVRRLVMDLHHYQDQFVDNINSLRETVAELQTRVESYLEPFRREGDGIAPADDGSQPVERIEVFAEQGGADFWATATDFLAGGLTGFLGIVAQTVMCIFVLVFILAQGPALHERIVSATAGEIERRRTAAQTILNNVNDDVQRYLFNRFATNTCVAILVGLIFYLYGLDFAFLLGIFAGLFNFIPYVGPIIGSVFPAAVAYVQFGELQAVFWCVLIYASVTGLEGNLVTPYVIGRHLKLNSLAVLLSAIFWGWMWGAIGLLLAIPIVATMKSVSENVDGLGGLAAFLRG